jgi:hypothetical protein
VNFINIKNRRMRQTAAGLIDISGRGAGHGKE